MYIAINKNRTGLFYKILCGITAFSFLFALIIPPQRVQAQSLPISVFNFLNLPTPGTMLPLSPAYTPAMIKGVMIHPDNPLKFNFILDQGNTNLTEKELEDESQKLIKYFLAALTIPEKEMWVNLSPYEKDRIIPNSFGETEMGRDLLAQDYLLKQVTASLMYPEDDLGSKFWERIYAKAREVLGTEEVPVNTFNKVWIVPQSAKIYEHQKGAYVVESHLKVMLESDYEHMKDSISNLDFSFDESGNSDISAQIIKETILPEIEREVNEGKTFANLRQIYNSMILATWYKQKLKESIGYNSILMESYIDKGKVKGVDIKDKDINQKIYNQYLEAFKVGVYNYIKEDIDEQTGETIPRKYFSGGVDWNEASSSVDVIEADDNVFDLMVRSSSSPVDVEVDLGILDKNGEIIQSSSPAEGHLVQQMKERFANLIEIPVVAVMYDIDENLAINKSIVKEALEIIYQQRLLGVPVMLITGRAYDPSEEVRVGGSLGIKDVLLDFSRYLEEKGVLVKERNKILEGLYVGSENGSYITNGFLEGNSRWKNYDKWLFDKLEIDPNKEKGRHEVLRSVLGEFQHQQITRRVNKERSYAFFAKRKYLLDVRKKIILTLEEKGLWDNHLMQVSVTENTVEVSFYKVSKSIGVEFLIDERGIKDDEHGLIVSSGDNGQRDGNDHSMLDRLGGLSSNLYDPESANMIALSLISGQAIGPDSTLWAMKQFKYKTQSGKVTYLNNSEQRPNSFSNDNGLNNPSVASPIELEGKTSVINENSVLLGGQNQSGKVKMSMVEDGIITVKLDSKRDFKLHLWVEKATLMMQSFVATLDFKGEKHYGEYSQIYSRENDSEIDFGQKIVVGGDKLKLKLDNAEKVSGIVYNTRRTDLRFSHFWFRVIKEDDQTILEVGDNKTKEGTLVQWDVPNWQALSVKLPRDGKSASPIEGEISSASPIIVKDVFVKRDTSYDPDKRVNQDYGFVDKEKGMIFVSDGVGGRPSGEDASRIVGETIRDYFKDIDLSKITDIKELKFLIEDSILLARTNILDAIRKDPYKGGMTATVVFGFYWKDISGEEIFVGGKIGDSRIYMYDKENKKLKQITVDDKVPGQSKISDSVAHSIEVRFDHDLEVEVYEVQPKDKLEDNQFIFQKILPNAVFLALTDGFEKIPPSKIQELIELYPNISELARALVVEAKLTGVLDDMTVVIVHFQSIAASPIQGNVDEITDNPQKLFDIWLNGKDSRDELIAYGRALGFEGFYIHHFKDIPLIGNVDPVLTPPGNEYVDSFNIYGQGIRDNIETHTYGEAVYLWRENSQGYEFLVFDWGDGVVDEKGKVVDDLQQIFDYKSFRKKSPGPDGIDRGGGNGLGLHHVAVDSFFTRLISVNDEKVRIVEKVRPEFSDWVVSKVETKQVDFNFSELEIIKKDARGVIVQGFIPRDIEIFEGEFSPISRNQILSLIELPKSTLLKNMFSWQVPQEKKLDKFKKGETVSFVYFDSYVEKNIIEEEVMIGSRFINGDMQMALKTKRGQEISVFDVTYIDTGKGILDVGSGGWDFVHALYELKVGVGEKITIGYEQRKLVDQRIQSVGRIVEIPSGANQGTFVIDVDEKEFLILSRTKIKQMFKNVSSSAIKVKEQKILEESENNRQRTGDENGGKHRFRVSASSPVSHPEDVMADDLVAKDNVRATKKGGIDLDPDLLNLDIEKKGEGVQIHFPILQNSPQYMDIEGFIPIIINITPITNLPLLLGFDYPFSEDEDSPREELSWNQNFLARNPEDFLQ